MPSTKKFDKPEGWRFDTFRSQSGYNIRYGCVEADPAKHRGTVVFAGGYGRHIEYYYEAINNWRDRGYSVYMMDWAGMGGSDREIPDQPQRPPTISFEQHARMLHEFTQNIVRPPREKPAFLCSHSFGGNITLRYLHMYEKRADFPFTGAIMGAPMVDINTFILPRQVFNRVVRAANKMGLGDMPMPEVSKMYTDFINAVAYRNAEPDNERQTSQENYKRETEHLQIGFPTPGWFAAAIKSADIVRNPKFLEQINTPVMILTAERDSMVSVKSQERAALHLPNAALVKLRGAKHGLWYDNDRVQDQLWNAVSTFTAGLCVRHKPRAALTVPLPDEPDLIDSGIIVIPPPQGPDQHPPRPQI
ncbi:MAG: alpha/beta hydrolase [Alphaproteobacteria bacterium]|nr:alpha/beta hydrolase [Alphaproteobacteria bacterium]